MNSRLLINVCSWFILLGAVGCSSVNDRALRVISSKASAYAIVNGTLLQGDLTIVPDRTGKITLSTGTGSDGTVVLACVGQSRYEASNSGVIDLRCSDGTFAALTFSLISETRGFAYGATSLGPASLAFGLPPSEAQAYLRAPINGKLVLKTGDVLELQ